MPWKVTALVFAAMLGCTCGRPATSGTSTAEPAAQAAAKTPDPAMATRAGYDDKTDPAKDLAALVPTAQASHRRILLVVGGEWCVWCHYLHDFLDKDTEIKRLWDERFVTLKVNWSEENRNEAFLSQYPKIPGYPHIFVLDENGKFLHSQGTEVLESGRGYSRDAVKTFLDEWGAR
jgi:thiol:disulfide interchange protein